jgi:hypothetical protein
MSIKSENRYKANSMAKARAIGQRNGEMEAMDRLPREQQQQSMRYSTRAQVKAWMVNHADHYDSMTQLACGVELALWMPFGCIDDETHWIWDCAYEAWSAIHGN